MQSTLTEPEVHSFTYEQSYDPFDPTAYLTEYYSELGNENKALLEFFHDAYAQLAGSLPGASMLEFGGGPTIYQLISAARHDLWIDVSDYLDINLRELERWLDDTPGRFAWDAFFAYVLELEGTHPDANAIQQRAGLIRQKVRRLLHGDARCNPAVEGHNQQHYTVVSANFVLEAITEDVEEWTGLLQNVLPLVMPGGHMIISTVVGARGYRVGERFFPATPITGDMLLERLHHAGFTPKLTRSVGAEHEEHQGYQGIFMVLAQREEAGTQA